MCPLIFTILFISSVLKPFITDITTTKTATLEAIPRKEIRVTSENISSHNKDIEEKTNYLENRINSYNKDEKFNDSSFSATNSKMIKNEVVDININKDFSRVNENSENKLEDSKEKKRIKFFSPNFLK